MRQIQPDRPRRGFLPQHDIDRKILHGRVQNLLHLAVQPVDLIHKQNIPLLEVIKDRRHLSGLLDRRAGGDLHMDPHLIGYDTRQGCLAQSRRAVKQHMVQGLPSRLGRINIYLQIILDLFLPDILAQHLGAKARLYVFILFRDFRRYDPSFHSLLRRPAILVLLLLVCSSWSALIGLLLLVCSSWSVLID
jgi:hypothetical protein